METGAERRAARGGIKRSSTLTWSGSGEDRQGKAALPPLLALMLFSVLLVLGAAMLVKAMAPVVVAVVAVVAAGTVVKGGEGKG